MKRVLTSMRPSHLRIALAVNSGPLSERICSGIPLKTNRLNNWSMTSSEVMRRSTKMARHSLVYSSRIVNILNGLPSTGPGSHEVIAPDVVLMLRP